jgi:alkanesulfonate monooxygenase SsuD/methylene tetrahydromethanopterin reductase-like flavin-dependent oxidoreductase (luciferase family)
MAATLDQISGGRLVLGVGAGWQPNEHAAYGLALPPAPVRIEWLDEACRVIRLLLRQRRSTAAGRAYQLTDAPCEPTPLQPRLPLLVGGGVSGSPWGSLRATPRTEAPKSRCSRSTFSPTR